MKAKFFTVLVATAIMCVMAVSAHAVTNCDTMKITQLSADASATAGGNLWLQNLSGAACGVLANGASQYYTLNPAEADKLMAVGLTAVSLGKNVWVSMEGDGSVGSMVNIISLTN